MTPVQSTWYHIQATNADVLPERALTRGRCSRRPGMVGGSIRTLVVDDDADIRDSLVVLLQLLGCESSAVECGEDALRILTDAVPDAQQVHVAFVDVSMPGMSGYDLASAYRRSSPHAIPTMLVATTGWGTEKDRERALREGFDIHLVKPLDMAQLHLVLAAVRSRHAPSTGPFGLHKDPPAGE